MLTQRARQYREAGYLLLEDGLGPGRYDCLAGRRRLYAHDSRTARWRRTPHRAGGPRLPPPRPGLRRSGPPPAAAGPAMQILSGDVYVPPVQDQPKAPMTGDVWP